MTTQHKILVDYTNSNNENLKHGNEFIDDLSKVLTRLLKTKPQIIDVSDLNNTLEPSTSFYLLWLHKDSDISDDFIKSLKEFKQVYVIVSLEQVKTKGLEAFAKYYLNNKNDDVYWVNIVNLAYDIYNNSTGSDIVRAKQKYIYFTQITGADLIYKNLIQSELKHFGFAGVSDINEVLDNIHAAITILPENEVSENEITLLRDELKSVITKDTVEKHFVWVKGTSGLTDNKLFNLLKAESLLVNSEVVNAPVEIFKSLLIKRLTTVPEQITINNSASDTIYFIHDVKDNYADKIVKELKKQGKQVISSKEVVNTTNPIKEHRNILVNSEAVVIHYPDNNAFWLLSKLNDLMKTPGYGKTKPFKGKFLLHSGDVQLQEDYIMSDIDIIKYDAEITTDKLEILSNKLL